MKKKEKERVEKLKEILLKKLRKFAVSHGVFLTCYPDGEKINSKKEITSSCFRQHTYICKTLCQKQCSSFKRKVYLCNDIGCTYYPVCISKDESLMQEFCKRHDLWEERKKLNTLYNKYFHLFAVYRGLKLDPEKTLRYLDMKMKKKKKKEGEKKIHGKISNSKSSKKSGKVRKRKRTSN